MTRLDRIHKKLAKERKGQELLERYKRLRDVDKVPMHKRKKAGNFSDKEWRMVEEARNKEERFGWGKKNKATMEYERRMQRVIEERELKEKDEKKKKRL